jgi:hypothetical protein
LAMAMSLILTPSQSWAETWIVVFKRHVVACR